MEVIENLREIQTRIAEACQRAARDPGEVRIIAVTKYVSIERAIEAVEAGVADIGENRDAGLIAKWEKLEDRASFHFIGTLQTRKVKAVIGKVDYIHSLDRLSLAEEINKRASGPVKCLVQVNVSGEESKHGLNPEEAIEFISGLGNFDKVIVEGLMTMAPYTDDEQVLRDCFRKLRELRGRVQELGLPFAPCRELSMGMSNDYEIAVEEGATMIRIGTALVGKNDTEVRVNEH
ncbi:YggS family pyridoxal phosphate enzyme [Bacillus sp. FJAT-27225]|uniref:YggS family pyridoxal phosphate-dependent enzyme n=1 Tax=Bacillus sp. FJAT-27225 TaxID=1743144 RepID=UPI00080C2998|nr:YggS family pyridoxal phosphate-dependent enzyme [Bacillus sp. FJAT-27225]OCA85523.1 YggS family pyridoxal phosphate enzyme [Bacillus sp. FJAT-27225]